MKDIEKRLLRIEEAVNANEVFYEVEFSNGEHKTMSVIDLYIYGINREIGFTKEAPFAYIGYCYLRGDQATLTDYLRESIEEHIGL